MTKRLSTKPALRLRPTDGLREDITIGVPVHWLATLREKADKLGLSVEDLLIQLCGHVASESEALASAAESPKLGGRRGPILAPRRVPQIVSA